MLWRSPLRSDSAALLGLRARRETRFTPSGRSARTVSASQMNEVIVASFATGHETEHRKAVGPQG